ncbi:MAG: hypothetical protein K0R38_2847 [Polyangiaceae bacterium]|jgi:hypothetical protein|nr:hypothetical protein [Polyangiaceae bacterium]
MNRNILSRGSGLALLLTFGCAVGTEAAGDEGTALGQAQARLEVGGECVVADEVITHTCAHANFGPFESVAAQPYPGFVFTDISAAHRSFSVSLPAAGGQYQGAVLYGPGESGRYAFFTTPGVTLSVLDSGGAPVPLAIEAAVPDELCGAMEQVAVYELDSSQVYTVVHGPTPSPTVSTIVEFIGEGHCEECEEVHLDASLSLAPFERQDAVAELEEPHSFQIPAELEVREGTAKVGTARLSFRSGTGPMVHCLYGAEHEHNAFELVGCTGGFAARDPAEADYFKLHINLGAALFGPIAVEAELPAVGCEDDHDHEEEP